MTDSSTLAPRLVKLDSRGNVSFVFNGTGILRRPQGLALDSTGNLWIGDGSTSGYGQVVHMTPTGTVLGAYPLLSNSYTLAAVVVDRSNYVFVTDTFNARVLKLNSTGAQLLSFSFPSTAGGPYGLAVDSSGLVYVNDQSHITVFTPSGSIYLTMVSTAFDSAIGYLGGSALDSADNFYLAGASYVVRFPPLQPPSSTAAAVALSSAAPSTAARAVSSSALPASSAAPSSAANTAAATFSSSPASTSVVAVTGTSIRVASSTSTPSASTAGSATSVPAVTNPTAPTPPSPTSSLNPYAGNGASSAGGATRTAVLLCIAALLVSFL